jgi:hypothetical protein
MLQTFFRIFQKIINSLIILLLSRRPDPVIEHNIDNPFLRNYNQLDQDVAEQMARLRV